MDEVNKYRLDVLQMREKITEYLKRIKQLEKETKEKDEIIANLTKENDHFSREN